MDGASPTIELGRSPRDLLGLNNTAGRANTGTGVTYLQIEFDLFEDHKSFSRDLFSWTAGSREARERFFEAICHTVHATAAASIVTDPHFGVAPGVAFRFHGATSLKEWEDGLTGILDGLAACAETDGILKEGDVISISLQMPVVQKGHTVFLPVDVDGEVKDLLNAFVDRYKVLVFIAAGNGDVDLDRYVYFGETYATLREGSKSILVGCASNDGSTYHQSNTGSCVDVFVPAGSLLAACYNYDSRRMAGDLLDSISAGFQRTSAATPLMAGFASLLQAERKQSGKALIDYVALRNWVLAETADSKILSPESCLRIMQRAKE